MLAILFSFVVNYIVSRIAGNVFGYLATCINRYYGLLKELPIEKLPRATSCTTSLLQNATRTPTILSSQFGSKSSFFHTFHSLIDDGAGAGAAQNHRKLDAGFPRPPPSHTKP